MLPLFFLDSSTPTNGDLLAYITNTGERTTQTTFTFSSVSIGAAFTDRLVIVPIFWDTSGSTRTISTVTIGGISATIIVQGGGTGGGTGIVQAEVPTGTTADIVVTFSANVLACDVAVYAADPTTNTPLDFGSSGYATSNPSTVSNIDVQAGGFSLAIHHLRSNATLTTSWNGTDTEGDDVSRLSTGAASLQLRFSSVLTTETNATRDWSYSATGTIGRSTCAASWI